jgi:Domain of Unknown Function (DUF1080)
MKRTLCTLFTALVAVAALHADDGWISMFNGKDLAGWKPNIDTPNVFSVEDGKIKCDGGRAHMFYMGPNGDANFKNFEFKAKVMTMPGANSGVYFHTKYQDKDWPAQGFEAQVNATHTDHRKTGSLYKIVDVMDNAPNKDGEWFDYEIRVEGKHVVLKVNGQVTVDWTQPEDFKPPQGMPGRYIQEGTIALQAHDPKSVSFYKDLYIRPLP